MGPCTTGQHMPAAGPQTVPGTLMAGAAGRWPQVTQCRADAVGTWAVGQEWELPFYPQCCIQTGVRHL